MSGLPLRKNPMMRFAGDLVLRLLGWQIQGKLPDVMKAVWIAAPHTSNWDFVIGIAAKYKLELDLQWLGKHTLFKKPFAGLFRWFGGIPVDRNSSQGIVQQTIEMFRSRDQFLLGLSPEGTRKKVERWKTGFYQIAKGAQVPVIPVAFDYSTRSIRIGTPMMPSASAENDFARYREFYSVVKGKFPQNFANISFPQESSLEQLY